jgi:outer membrane protein TolC
VQRAAEHASSSALAAQEVVRVEALLEEARSGALPGLSANASYVRNDAARYASAVVQTGPNSVGTITVRAVPESSNNVNLTLSAPLVAASRWYQWSHAADQTDVARASERDVRRLVTLSAARAYLTIIAQKRAVEVSQRAVETAAAHYDYAHTRRLGGVGNLLDEARADQQLATSQAQLEGALAGLVRAQEALGVATGGDTPLDARDEPDLTGGPPTADEGEALVEEGRSDVLLARQRLHAAHRVAADSWADWLPTLSLVAQLYRQEPPGTTTPLHGWQAQLLLSFPLFEGGLRAGLRREREALDTEARLLLEGTRQQAHSDVRSAYANLRYAVNAQEQSHRAADRAHTALSLVEQAFQAGATTSLDVTDAERTARDADTAAVVADDSVRQSRLDLLAAVGRFPAL